MTNADTNPIPALTTTAAATLPKYIRTRNLQLYRKVFSPAWGTFYRQEKEDPMGATELPVLKLVDNFPKVPAELMTAWIKLAQYFCHLTENEHHNASTGSYEVQCLLLRREPDFKEWRIVVPTQIVSTTAVDAETEHWIDIVTGEEGSGFPPLGWAYAGSMHSHNKMGAFWSGRDDHFELGSPGLHATIGRLDGNKGYEICSSVVLAFKRNVIEVADLIDLTWKDEVNFHPKVLEYVQLMKYSQKATVVSTSTATISDSNTAVWLRQDFEGHFQEDYSNPRNKKDKKKKRSGIPLRDRADFGFTKLGTEKKLAVDLGNGLAANRSVSNIEMKDLFEVLALIRNGLKEGVIDENDSEEFFDLALGIHRAYSTPEKVDLLYEVLEQVLDTNDYLEFATGPSVDDNTNDVNDPFYCG